MQISDLELIHQDSVSSLYFDPALPGSYIVWHGFAASADFRAACLRSLALVRERRTYKSISDARNLRVISLADQKWVAEEFLPMLVELNISPRFYSGTIVPQDFFGRQSLENIMEQVDEIVGSQYKGLTSVTRYFESADAARAWLLTVDADPTAAAPQAPAVAATANNPASNA